MAFSVAYGSACHAMSTQRSTLPRDSSRPHISRMLRQLPRMGRFHSEVTSVKRSAVDDAQGSGQAPQVLETPVTKPDIEMKAEDFDWDFSDLEMSSDDTKAALLDTIFGTNRGLNVSGEIRAEINELVAQLEASNPTPKPTESQELLSGKWVLAYTSNSELVALLLAGQLPGVTIEEISQTIEPATMTVENRCEIMVPGVKGAVSSTAKFEVRSGKRVQVKFTESTVYTPALDLNSLMLPNDLNILGQTIDLTLVRDALSPLQQAAQQAASAVTDIISKQPDLNIKFPEMLQNESWLLTTYLDDTLRISRGEGGSVYVLTKELKF